MINEYQRTYNVMAVREKFRLQFELDTLPAFLNILNPLGEAYKQSIRDDISQKESGFTETVMGLMRSGIALTPALVLAKYIDLTRGIFFEDKAIPGLLSHNESTIQVSVGMLDLSSGIEHIAKPIQLASQDYSQIQELVETTEEGLTSIPEFRTHRHRLSNAASIKAGIIEEGWIVYRQVFMQDPSGLQLVAKLLSDLASGKRELFPAQIKEVVEMGATLAKEVYEEHYSLAAELLKQNEV